MFDLSFSEFITTKIIKVLYIIAIIGSAFGALAVMFGMFVTKTLFGIVGGLIADCRGGLFSCRSACPATWICGRMQVYWV